MISSWDGVSHSMVTRWLDPSFVPSFSLMGRP